MKRPWMLFFGGACCLGLGACETLTELPSAPGPVPPRAPIAAPEAPARAPSSVAEPTPTPTPTPVPVTTPAPIPPATAEAAAFEHWDYFDEDDEQKALEKRAKRKHRED